MFGSKGFFFGKNQVYRDTASDFFNSFFSQKTEEETTPKASPSPSHRTTTQVYSPSYSHHHQSSHVTNNVTNHYHSPSVERTERVVERVVVVESPRPQATNNRLMITSGLPETPPAFVDSPAPVRPGKNIRGVAHPSGCFCSGCKTPPINTSPEITVSPPPPAPNPAVRKPLNVQIPLSPLSAEMLLSPKLDIYMSPKLDAHLQTPRHSSPIISPVAMSSPYPYSPVSFQRIEEEKKAREKLETQLAEMRLLREKEAEELKDLKNLYSRMATRMEETDKKKQEKQESKELLRKQIEEKEALKKKHDAEIERNREIYSKLAKVTAKNASQKYYDRFGSNPGSDKEMQARLDEYRERVSSNRTLTEAYRNLGDNPNSRNASPATRAVNTPSPSQSLRELQARIPALDLSGEIPVDTTLSPQTTPDAEDSIVIDADFVARHLTPVSSPALGNRGR